MINYRLSAGGIQMEEQISQKNSLSKQGQGGSCIQTDACRHKTLEERADPYDGKLNLEGELNWKGEPVGNELW